MKLKKFLSFLFLWDDIGAFLSYKDLDALKIFLTIIQTDGDKNIFG